MQFRILLAAGNSEQENVCVFWVRNWKGHSITEISEKIVVIYWDKIDGGCFYLQGGLLPFGIAYPTHHLPTEKKINASKYIIQIKFQI